MATNTNDESPFAFAVVYNRQPQSPVGARQIMTSPAPSPRRKNYVDSKRTIQEKQQQSKVRRIVLDDSFSQWLGSVEWGSFDESFKDSKRSNRRLALPPRPPAETQSLHTRSMHLYPLKDSEAKPKGKEHIKSESWHGMRTCFVESTSSHDKAPKLPTRGRETELRRGRKSSAVRCKSRKQRDTSRKSKNANWTMDDILSIHKELFEVEENNDYSTRSAPSTSRAAIQMSPTRGKRGTRRGGSIMVKSGMSTSLRGERTTTSRSKSPLSSSLPACGGRLRLQIKNNRARSPGSLSPVRRPALQDQCRRLKIVF